MTDHTEVAAIYFPSWHDEPRRSEKLTPGFTEWELVKAGRPRFDGHRQPIVPEWGYVDETDPDVMARSCELAASAGIDAFLWDWYWYDGADFLNRPLNDVFLKLPDPPIAFALMWANHDWVNAFPASVGVTPELWFEGAIPRGEFDRMTTIVVDRYLTHPSYWRVNDKAWFTIFRLNEFVKGVGGWEAAKEALGEFRSKARVAGVGELHLDAMGGYESFSPEEIRDLGIDSVGQYSWGEDLPIDEGLAINYDDMKNLEIANWSVESARQIVDYIPHVSMGWDSTSRVNQNDDLKLSAWPYLPVIVDHDPASFADAIERALDFTRQQNRAQVIMVNAWNEWTEGSYLEPDTVLGDAHLEALKAVLEKDRPERVAPTAAQDA